MSQGAYPQGQPQSFQPQNATLGSVAYSSGGLPVSGQSQNAVLGSVQYPSGGQPISGAMAVPPQVNPAFTGQQPSMGGQSQFGPEMIGFAPAGAVYAPGAAGPAFEGASTGAYGQPQMPAQPQQQSQKRSIGMPPGMTRESMMPGYAAGTQRQPGELDPNWSFRDSFGQKRNNCCTIS